MTGFFEGFGLGDVREVRIRSYTVGVGRSAQLVALAIEVWHDNSYEPTVLEIDFGDDGLTLAGAQALIRAVNRQARVRRGEAP